MISDPLWRHLKGTNKTPRSHRLLRGQLLYLYEARLPITIWRSLELEEAKGVVQIQELPDKLS